MYGILVELWVTCCHDAMQPRKIKILVVINAKHYLQASLKFVGHVSKSRHILCCYNHDTTHARHMPCGVHPLAVRNLGDL